MSVTSVEKQALPVKKGFYRRHRNEFIAYGIMAVPLLWWGVFFLYAFFKAFVMSFTDWSLAPDLNFLGLDNYIRALKDETVLEAFKNTVIWTVVMLVGVNGFGIFIASAINSLRNKTLGKIVLACMFWPTLVSAAASAEIQKFILGESESGLINFLLLKMGLIDRPLGWLSNPDIALLGLMITPFFLGFGIKMIIYYTGIKNIPGNYYDAASLETDSKWMVFRHITIPLLRPVIVFNLVLSLIEGFKVIAPMQLITNGGPLNSTNSVLFAMYTYGITESEMGYGSAIAFLLFLVILAVTVLQLRLDREKVSYE